MAGCYGSSAEDQHFEAELHEHLDRDDAEAERDAWLGDEWDRKREETQ